MYLSYRPEIDGLRSLAVIPVILFHAGFAPFGGGFVGVDVFFVISGYLITSIILDEMDDGAFSVVKFYERRARRILPALFFMMAAITPLAWLWLMPRDLEDFARSLIAVSFFSSNILFWRESGYFDMAAEFKPLLHTWSLAVEEQYYILFPLFLMLVWQIKRRWLIGLLFVIFLCSFSLGLWGAYNRPAAAFYLLPARGWEILIGAFVAFYLSKDSALTAAPALRETLSLLGLLLLLYAVLVFDHKTPVPGFHTLVPTIGTALIIVYAREGTLVNRFLRCRVLVAIGLISYSAYLWHQPLIAFAKYRSEGIPSPWLMGLLCVLTLPLAYISWRFIEAPFRRKEVVGRGAVFASAAVAAAVFVGFGSAGMFTNGFEESFVKNRLDSSEQGVYRLIQHHTKYDPEDHMVDNGECIFWSKYITQRFSERFAACTIKYGKAVVVVGDSHAMNVFNIAAKSGLHLFVVGVSQGGCRPQENKPTCHYTAFDAFAANEAKYIRYILFHQSGAYFIEDANGNVDSPLAFVAGKRYRFVAEDVDKSIRYLVRLNSIVPTFWIGPFVEARVDFSRHHILGGDRFFLNPRSVELFSLLDETIKKQIDAGAEFPAENYIPFNSIINIAPDFVKVDRCLTYMDVDHFSLCGEDLIAPYFHRFFSEWHGPEKSTVR